VQETVVGVWWELRAEDGRGGAILVTDHDIGQSRAAFASPAIYKIENSDVLISGIRPVATNRMACNSSVVNLVGTLADVQFAMAIRCMYVRTLFHRQTKISPTLCFSYIQASEVGVVPYLRILP
jgi:hypothetical protein